MRILILGAGGFIGDHLVSHHKSKGDIVTGADIKNPQFRQSAADRFIIADLTKESDCDLVFDRDYDLVYQLAADIGGAGYLFTGENDANVMSNNLTMNINVLNRLKKGKQRLLFTSSACVYPKHNQISSDSIKTSEDSVYPADPDSDYGWEKLTSERLYQTYARNHGMVNHIVRLHNVYGPRSTYEGGREKSPAAICRKVALASDAIEIWGDGAQVRSFLHVSDMLAAFDLIIDNDVRQPVNVGNAEMISINDLAKMVISLSNKQVSIKHIPGPIGVAARSSDNKLIESLIGWKPKVSLQQGMEDLYDWILDDITKKGRL